MTDYLTLRQARISMNLSLEEAAAGICSASLLSLIERGQRTLTDKVGKALAERLATGLQATQKSSFSDEYLHFLATLRQGEAQTALDLARNIGNKIEAELATALALEELGQKQLAVEGLTNVAESPDVQPHELAPAAQGLVRIESARGDFYSAIFWAEDALRRIKLAGAENLAETYPLRATLAGIYSDVGDYNKALDLIRSQGMSQANGWNRVISLWSEGTLLYSQGQYAQAATMFREAYFLTLDHDRKLAQMRLLQTLVWLEAKAGEVDFIQGRKYLDQAQTLFRELNATRDIAGLLNTYAVLEAAAGDSAEAETKARQSLEIARTLRDFSKAELLVENAEVLQNLIDVEELRQILSEALGILAETKADRLVAATWAKLGKVYETLGDIEASYACFKASIEVAGLLPSQVTSR